MVGQPGKLRDPELPAHWYPTDDAAIKEATVSYFASSRLHFIGTWKARFRVYLSEVLAGGGVRVSPPSASVALTAPTQCSGSGLAWGSDGELRGDTVRLLRQLRGGLTQYPSGNAHGPACGGWFPTQDTAVHTQTQTQTQTTSAATTTPLPHGSPFVTQGDPPPRTPATPSAPLAARYAARGVPLPPLFHETLVDAGTDADADADAAARVGISVLDGGGGGSGTQEERIPAERRRNGGAAVPQSGGGESVFDDDVSSRSTGGGEDGGAIFGTPSDDSGDGDGGISPWGRSDDEDTSDDDAVDAVLATGAGEVNQLLLSASSDGAADNAGDRTRQRMAEKSTSVGVTGTYQNEPPPSRPAAADDDARCTPAAGVGRRNSDPPRSAHPQHDDTDDTTLRGAPDAAGDACEAEHDEDGHDDRARRLRSRWPAGIAGAVGAAGAWGAEVRRGGGGCGAPVALPSPPIHAEGVSTVRAGSSVAGVSQAAGSGSGSGSDPEGGGTQHGQPGVPPSWWLHVDMDCFFCSVAIANSPNPGSLKDRPVAVTSGRADYSEVCSPNYPARAYGVKANKFLSNAMEKCRNDLVAIPVSTTLFRQCERVWKQVYHILVTAAGGDLKSVIGRSCDEAFVRFDANTVSEAGIRRIGEQIRVAIDMQTGCQASVGIAPSQILAKICTTRAKPDGLELIPSIAAGKALLATLPARELPGIGRETADKLYEVGVVTVRDVAKLKRGELERLVGQQRGRKLRDAASGRDDASDILTHAHTLDELLRTQKATRVSAEKNFAMRNLTLPATKTYIRCLCDEIHSRIPSVGPASGAPVTGVTLKILIAVPGWTEPKKLNGIGRAFEWSKTQKCTAFPDAVDIAIGLADAIPYPTERIRGVGVAVALGQVGGATVAPTGAKRGTVRDTSGGASAPSAGMGSLAGWVRKGGQQQQASPPRGSAPSTLTATHTQRVGGGGNGGAGPHGGAVGKRKQPPAAAAPAPRPAKRRRGDRGGGGNAAAEVIDLT